MAKGIAAIAAVGTALAMMPASAFAELTQVTDATTLPAAGSGLPKGNSYVKLKTYLATRDSSSPRPMRMANPVGKIVLTFPSGGRITPKETGVPVCNVRAGLGELIMAKCSKSKIGSGWALVNTGQNLGVGGTPQARSQLAGAPPACAKESGNPLDWTQYSKLFGLTADCVPQGHLWNRVSVYLGSIPEGSSSSVTKGDPNSLVFVSQNIAAVVSFSGQVARNVLTVNLPALNGTGSYPGELIGGWVLSDFFVFISNPRYLKAGPCPVGNKWTLRSDSTYSQRKENDGLKVVRDPSGTPIIGPNGKPLMESDPTETFIPIPAAKATLDTDPCRR